MLLNGLWHFSLDGGEERLLPVPGCFDMDDRYRFQRGRGCYHREVMMGGLVELSCDGLGLSAEFFWDGCLIGEMPSAYVPVKIRFHAGAEKIHELKIICDNTILENPESEFRLFYDFYGFGGIYRDVCLRRLPTSYIDYVRVLPLNLEDGTIALHVETGGIPCPLNGRIENGPSFELPGPGDYQLTLPDPVLWSPEQPYLYHLFLQCGEDSYQTAFGMRTITSENGGIYLNGRKLKLVGVNRHDVSPETGAAVSENQLRNDLIMIRQAGFNCIRGAHYPQSEKMLDLADELGLLVWEEILGWENPLDSLQNTEFCRRQQHAMRQIIRRDINHPSVIFWGFLNEAETNSPEARSCIEAMVGLIRNEDSSRLTTYATMYGNEDQALDLVDVISFNTYPGWYGGNNRFFEPEIVYSEITGLLDFVKQKEVIAAKPVLISEIGADAFIGDHSGRRWSENYQSQLVICALKTVLRDSRCAGILFWQFCDSPVDDNIRIIMRPYGYNNKGLVDRNRSPKQAWKELAAALKDGNISSLQDEIIVG